MNHTSSLSILACFVFLFLGSSCSQRYYVPTDTMLLTIDRKGSATISTGLGLAKNPHASLLMAYSPIQHVALAINAFRDVTSYKEEYRTRNYAIEGGLGFYYPHYRRPRRRAKNQIKMAYDCYLGYGLGAHQRFRFRESSAKLHFKKNFIQANVHFRKTEGFAFRTGLKITRVNYDKVILLGMLPWENENRSFLDGLETYNNFTTIEYSNRIEFGRPHCKAFVSTVMSNNISKNVVEDFDISPFMFHVGVTVAIFSNKIKKKKKKKKK